MAAAEGRLSVNRPAALPKRKSPRRHALFLLGNGKAAGVMGASWPGCRTVAQQHGHLGLECLFHLPHQPLRHIVHVGRVGQVARQQIKRGGTLFAPPLGPFLPAHARGELPQHECHHEIHAEHHDVLDVRQIRM
jgi:hypothetical protein